MPEASDLDLVHGIIRNLNGALSAAALYSPEHTRVMEHFARITDSFQQFLRIEPEFLIAAVDHELLYKGKPLSGSANARRLLRYCDQENIGFIRLYRGFTVNELQQLVKVLLGKEPSGSLKQMTSRIQIGIVDAPEDHEIRPIHSFAELTEAERQEIQKQFDNISGQAPLDTSQITTLVAGLIAAFRQEANPLLALVPIRMQDEYTFTHSVDVGILNIAQAMSLGIEGQLLHDIGIAGMLHDAGKIFVDKEILNKPGHLTDEEFARIQQHPSRGAQYLMNQEGISRVAVFSAYEHHMRYDLKGYPRVPAHWKLNICSQMTMISDTFDALRTRRAYKDPWDFSKVSGLMLNLAGSQLNPDLTLNFLKTLAHMGEDLEQCSELTEAEDLDSGVTGCSCAIENPRCG